MKNFLSISVVAVLLIFSLAEQVLAGIDTVQTFPPDFPTVKSPDSK